jgi:methylglyoxal synthase
MGYKQPKNKKQGRIAFITTPKCRDTNPEMIESFVYGNMYSLCHSFSVMTTGRTYTEFLKGRILNRKYDSLTPEMCELIERDTKFPIKGQDDLDRWCNVVNSGLEPTVGSFQGMIHVTYELVEGRLDAVIHLTDWEDKTGKADSAVLSREANVHNVPIATNCDTAQSYADSWKAQQITAKGALFPKRQRPKNPPLKGIRKGDRVLAMIAHDNMKLELCRFAVENATHIFQHYDWVLATGTTGGWVKRFMEATGKSQREISKIKCCNSGPLGGDIQIAYAVVQGLCQKIVFLQDPSVSHPHDVDIRLFEQAIIAKGLGIKLAPNVESAKLLILAP